MTKKSANTRNSQNYALQMWVLWGGKHLFFIIINVIACWSRKKDLGLIEICYRKKHKKRKSRQKRHKISFVKYFKMNWVLFCLSGTNNPNLYKKVSYRPIIHPRAFFKRLWVTCSYLTCDQIYNKKVKVAHGNLAGAAIFFLWSLLVVYVSMPFNVIIYFMTKRSIFIDNS